MKRWFMVGMLLVAMALPMAGCATFGGSSGGGNDWKQNVPQLKEDISLFSKLATRMILSEAKTPPEDVELIEGYLVALRDLLAVPGEPNFDDAKLLVGNKLPSKYRVYGLTIINVIERYLRSADLDVTEDQELIVQLIFAAIDGSLTAVQEFSVG